MTADAHSTRQNASVTSTGAPATPPAAVRRLLRWYQPYLAGRGRLMTGVVVGTLVVITCQALIPWLVEVILHHGEWNATLLLILVGLVIVQLGVGYATHLGVHQAANLGALALRERLFGSLLRSRVLRQQGLLRSSVVLRITQDVDRVSEAYESTLAFGIPGLARLIVSLALLTVIDWRAGLTMTVVSLAFLLIRRRMGRSLLAADRTRLALQSELGETVDETISNARLLGGLRLTGWQGRRFGRKAHELEEASHRQGIILNRLILAAHTAALVGLVAVVFFALAFSRGEEDLAAVAAALLYVEGAVRGLEALPPWIRDVQRSSVAQSRIEDILDEPDVVTLPADAPGPTPDAPAGLALEAVSAHLPSGVVLDATSATVPASVVVGVVTAAGTEPDDILELLAGLASPSHGRVVLDGADVRAPVARDAAFYVPTESEVFSASVTELLGAVAAGTSDKEATSRLGTVGLGHVAAMPDSLHRSLGPDGIELTVNERQRLMLAIALAARPRVLLVGSLLAFADIDSALPLIDVLRAGDQESTLLSVRSPDVAESVDAVLFVHDGQVLIGSHQSLLVDVPAYATLWQHRLSVADVDLSVVGIDESDQARLMTRLVTEHYAPGELIYRQGSPADRIVFVISGHVEITTTSRDGSTQRVAVLGPGNHCGDLRLATGELRAENAVALDDCVVRSLSRQAIQAGLTGLLDRTPAERRIVESLLRLGPGTTAELQERLAGMDPAAFASSLALLVRDGAVRQDGEVVSAVLQRSSKAGARELLDRLGDL